MSIVECTSSKSPLLELISECLDEKQWEEYLKAIDDEINFLIEWEKDMYDEVISCIETLIEAGYFYEEYLEEHLCGK